MSWRILISESSKVPRMEIVERLAHLSAEETAHREERAKEVALQQLSKKAHERGGNALINVRAESKRTVAGHQVTYRGTAVKVKKKDKKNS
jgi:uncharacterized protein YbjQ (UPF0145 family)